MEKGYEFTYQTIIHKLAECDLDEAAARLGLAPAENGIVKLRFLGREYEIDRTGVRAADGLPSDPTHRSILVYYITSKGSGEPGRSFCPLRHFIPGSMGMKNLPWMTAPLVREFGNDYAGFFDALGMLGAEFEGSSDKGGHIWTYRLLPKMPVQIVYLEADEEFPCEINLKLDESAGRFMEFEQLAFLCGCLVSALAKLGQTRSST